MTEELRRMKNPNGGTSKCHTARKLVSEHVILNSCDVDLTFYECPAEFFVAQMTNSEIENLAKSVSSSENDFFLTGAANVREKALSYWKDKCTGNSIFQQNIEHCKS